MIASPLGTRLPLRAASWYWPLGFALAAAALGSYQLGSESLWVDEAASAGFAMGGPGAWIADHNMALYYMLLGGCVRLFGHSEAALRGLSVLCFAGSAVVLYRLVELGFGPLPARIAAALHVSNAFLVQFAQEARGYSLALLLILVAQLSLMRILERGGARWIGLYALSLSLAMYAHLFALWILLAHAVVCAPRCVSRSPARWRLCIAGALAALLCVPLLLQIAGASAAQVSWIRPVSWRAVVALPVIWTGGNGWLALATCTLFAWFVWGTRSHDASVREATRMIVAWLGVPFAAALLVSVCVAPMLLPKYLIMSVPALQIGAAVSLARAPRRVTWSLFAVMLLLAALCLARDFRNVDKEPWRTAVRALATHVRRAEPLILELPCPEPFYYYVERLGLADLPQARWPARAWGYPVPEEGPLTRIEALAQLAREVPERIWSVSNRRAEPPAHGPLVPGYRLEREQRFASAPNPWDPLFADDAARVILVRSWVRSRF